MGLTLLSGIQVVVQNAEVMLAVINTTGIVYIVLGLDQDNYSIMALAVVYLLIISDI